MPPTSPRVRKASIAAAALVAASPAALAAVAHAATHTPARSGALRAIVVASQPQRKTVVVSAGGQIRTLRVPKAVKARLGTVVTAKTTVLADGTLRATALRAVGRAKKVPIAAVVVSTKGKDVELAAGGSVFVVRNAALAKASKGVSPGTVVDGTITTNAKGTTQTAALAPVGSATMFDLAGSLATLKAGTLAVAVPGAASTTLSLPSGFKLPSGVGAGKIVQALVTYDPKTHKLVLLSVLNDAKAATATSAGVGLGNLVLPAATPTPSTPSGVSGTSGVSGVSGTSGTSGTSGVPTLSGTSGTSGTPAPSSTNLAVLEAEGRVVAVTATSITVQSEDSSPITFALPPTLNLAAIHVGDHVSIQATLSGSTLTVAGVRDHSSGTSAGLSATPPGGENGGDAPLPGIGLSGVPTSLSGISGISGVVPLGAQPPGPGTGPSAMPVFVRGTVVSVTSTSITLQEGGQTVTVPVSASVDTAALKPGQTIMASGTPSASGTPTVGFVMVVPGGSGSDHHGGDGSGDGGDHGGNPLPGTPPPSLSGTTTSGSGPGALSGTGFGSFPGVPGTLSGTPVALSGTGTTPPFPSFPGFPRQSSDGSGDGSGGGGGTDN